MPGRGGSLDGLIWASPIKSEPLFRARGVRGSMLAARRQAKPLARGIFAMLPC